MRQPCRYRMKGWENSREECEKTEHNLQQRKDEVDVMVVGRVTQQTRTNGPTLGEEEEEEEERLYDLEIRGEVR